MRTLRILLFLGVYLSGCALFKQTQRQSAGSTSSYGQQDLLRLDSQQLSRREASRYTFRADSSRMRYEMFLWPKGEIRFGPQGSFNGSFDSIRIKGKLNQGSAQQDAAVLTEADSQHTSRSSGHREQYVSQLKTAQSTRKTRPIWIVAGLAVLCAAAVSAYKYLFS